MLYEMREVFRSCRSAKGGHTSARFEFPESPWFSRLTYYILKIVSEILEIITLMLRDE